MRPLLWTARQRGVVLGIILLLIGYLLLLDLWHPQAIDDPPPPLGPRYGQLQDKVDPNTADQPTLAALPGMGQKRAAELIAYRQQHQRMFPHEPAFRELRDLLKARGIGVSTLQNLQPYLMFPSTQPATSALHERQ